MTSCAAFFKKHVYKCTSVGIVRIANGQGQEALPCKCNTLQVRSLSKNEDSSFSTLGSTARKRCTPAYRDLTIHYVRQSNTSWLINFDWCHVLMWKVNAIVPHLVKTAEVEIIFNPPRWAGEPASGTSAWQCIVIRMTCARNEPKPVLMH